MEGTWTISSMVKMFGFGDSLVMEIHNAALKQAVEEEREACAKLAYEANPFGYGSKCIADAIRARGQADGY